MVNIALLGCGTVGSGVVRLFAQNSELIEKRIGTGVAIKKVLEKDPDKARAFGIRDEQLVASIDEILADEEIQIVVELIGGIEPAYSFIIRAMQNGKHVVTANKDLIAVKGKEIFETAEQNQVDFYFEASVAGGIPIIAALKQSLAANRIDTVIGILNGTTNYILTKMSREGLTFDTVLKEAQELGYAESDPTSDVEGLDAARKIAILSSLAFNTRTTFEDVYVEGISGISPLDIEYGRELGYVIKLLAIAREVDGRIHTRVHPAMLKRSHPLAVVDDVFNAVFVQGDAVGDLMFYGRGAGQMPTASAVAGDIMEICRNIKSECPARLGCTCFDNKPVISINELINCFYIRLEVTDRPGVLAEIASVFGKNNVSIATVLQKTSGDLATLILITHEVKEQYLQDALQILKSLDVVAEINNVIRLEG